MATTCSGALVGFVNDDQSPVLNCTQEGRVGVAENATFQRSGKHELGHCSVTMELDVFSRATQKLEDVVEFEILQKICQWTDLLGTA